MRLVLVSSVFVVVVVVWVVRVVWGCWHCCFGDDCIDGIIIDIAMDGHVVLDAKMQEEKTLMRSRGNGMQATVARVRC